MNRKIIGLVIVTVFAISIVIGGAHSALTVIEASSAAKDPGNGGYVARLATNSNDDPALAALRYVCPFH